MPGVKHDKAHSLEHPPLYSLHDLVGHLVVTDVAPPGQDVGVRQDGVAQTVLGLVERRHPDHGPLPKMLPYS